MIRVQARTLSSRESSVTHAGLGTISPANSPIRDRESEAQTSESDARHVRSTLEVELLLMCSLGIVSVEGITKHRAAAWVPEHALTGHRPSGGQRGGTEAACAWAAAAMNVC